MFEKREAGEATTFCRTPASQSLVVPAKPGTPAPWIPACAGMMSPGVTLRRVADDGGSVSFIEIQLPRSSASLRMKALRGYSAAC